MRALGGNLKKLRSAMARQQEYDESTVKSISDLANALIEAGLLPATTTGSIIKRRRNNLALDVTGAKAFSVILDHLKQMSSIWQANGKLVGRIILKRKIGIV